MAMGDCVCETESLVAIWRGAVLHHVSNGILSSATYVVKMFEIPHILNELCVVIVFWLNAAHC